mmetsp:Transcript_26273/g.37335  ORF Transcript_26273/g.37335 Transcript_26273/m.37335 type:complete len:926 (-) Transcript_26273:55-2832(-)|eukprot:CAMPEP_0202444568 /NCGR_PEP_ID=MMETSP1360-20130828/3593_1 /ASSEMBLY_ACC=CAM_ASM_000848 /TAXON_ID=515479 /ORGANISM="Licmophora paradoxa, Strain CCMP2313" /LENGTH=925 /DNA_ID=CAMNT_0049060587 /DNA_START=64 /DNA_END=2841 /DNA_ORIENTATION=+
MSFEVNYAQAQDGWEVHRTPHFDQPPSTKRTSSSNGSNSRTSSRSSSKTQAHRNPKPKVTFNADQDTWKTLSEQREREPSGSHPIDLDLMLDDESLFDDSDDEFMDDDEEFQRTGSGQQSSAFFNKDVHNIPGSPWAKPSLRHGSRPTEPLSIAKYASTLSFIVTVAMVVYLFIVSAWFYSAVGRVIVECILAVFTFFGLFWNVYFTISSFMKCFIPADCFRNNGKYHSVKPEAKHPTDDWMSVTIQIPVYKESLQEVLGPTLKSCIKARDHYRNNTATSCNIVVCDDGMMNLLRDNFAAAEMLWDSVQESHGKVTNINTLLKPVPKSSRRHLKGLRSKNIVEVLHRMVYYYRCNIGFVARSTVDRRGKFKKAGNLNSHLRLVFGAQNMAQERKANFEDCIMDLAHNSDGSRSVMFGNNVNIGELIIVNDADARMQSPVIMKTVPEFLNDKSLGFTQHATKTMDDQRGGTYFLNMLSTYTDALYQGHFLLSSILGCHPPLVGHSVFLRSEAVRQCGRMRMLRKAQRWLKNIGLPFLDVAQVGVSNVNDENHTEYWSESHVSEDFELMIHLYNIGYSGRYVAYPDCEFQEGITRTFDEEAGRHRKFSLGAHELMFNSFQDMLGHGIYTNLFHTFLTCDMPSYYKIFLTAYLQSYMAGGVYLIVFAVAATVRLVDAAVPGIDSIWAFSPASVLVMNIVIYYVVGYTTFLIALCRMHACNKDLFFPEYRKRGKLYLMYKMIRYSMLFQVTFYSVMGNYFFLGSMDHMMSRPGIVGATNKDSITVSRCSALWETIKFNAGSWMIAVITGGGAIAILLEDVNWDFACVLDGCIPFESNLQALVFSVPALLMSISALFVPLLLNPYVWGWPCVRKPKQKKKESRRSAAKGSNKGGDIAKPKKIGNSDRVFSDEHSKYTHGSMAMESLQVTI